MTYDWPALVDELNALLKLRTIPFGMKMFARREDMEAIPKIRRPQSIHTLDQIVGQASRLGWTVGITGDDLVGAQCRAVVGLGAAKTEAWQSGAHMTGVWFSTPEDARAHQDAMHCVPDGQYDALAVGPLSSGKLDPPDIAERRYGGVLDEEMLMATPPEYLVSAIAGMKALSKNGFRYPFPQYGVQQDVRAGMAVSYPGRG